MKKKDVFIVLALKKGEDEEALDVMWYMNQVPKPHPSYLLTN